VLIAAQLGAATLNQIFGLRTKRKRMYNCCIKYIARFGAVYSVLTVTLSGCLDPYNSNDAQDYSYLVVDGFANSADGSSALKLTRTKSISSKDDVSVVTNAQVTLEDESGLIYNFTENEDGEYILEDAVLDKSKKYKLKINSVNNSAYQSDFVSVTETPPIDSITWKQLDTNIEIYANTHDEQMKSHYYRWKYVETWSYTSPFKSLATYNDHTKTIELRAAEDDIYNCYKTYHSSDIIIFSTRKLQYDEVKQLRLVTFSISSLKLQKLYSIEVEQYALSEEAYNYWRQLKMSTENLGSIFDPQPSQVIGNIHCVSNPSETVLGFFSIGTTTKKRIFIHARTEVDYPRGTRPFDQNYAACKEDTLFLGEIPLYLGNDLLTSPVYVGHTVVGYSTSTPLCVDCRVAGGINIKPAFWP
jgi:hypothetical protein